MAISFEQAQRLWDTRRGDSKQLRPEVGPSSRLHKFDGYFTVRLYSTDVVEIHPDHYVLRTGSWATQTTMRVIRAVTAAWVYQHTVKNREGSTRVNGFPFFDGVRVDRRGNIIKEDIRPDRYTRVTTEGAAEYAKLFRWLRTMLRTREALGEFQSVASGGVRALSVSTLVELNKMRLAGCDFLPTEYAKLVMTAAGSTANLGLLQSYLRDEYHRLMGNTYIEEVW